MAFNKLSAVLYVAFVGFALAKDCEINIKNDVPKIEPVYLVSEDGTTYDLFKPDGETTTIADGTQLLLLCAGKKNTITSLSKQSVELTCSSGSFKDSSKKTHTISSLSCKSIPSSDLQETEESCGESGVIFNSGFKYGDDGFATAFEVCYNADKQQVFYTKNVINGKAIDHSISESKRRSFTADGMGLKTTAVNKLYTTKTQIAKFEELFGKSQTYVSSKMFFARGHLSPDADFIFRYEQLSTYYYMNVKPEYQSINAGNWLRVESAARSAASKLATDLSSYNGVMGNLEIDGVKIYLDDDNLFEAPEYYFKVLKDEENDAAIVMISYMNPYITDTASVEFCSNVCDKANMSNEHYTTIEKGYTFCCEFNDFAKHYTGLPSTLSASKLLTL